MKTNVSHKVRTYLLLIGLVVGSYIIYQLSFSNTFELMTNCEELSAKVEQASNSGLIIPTLKAELYSIDELLKVSGSSSSNVQYPLLEKVSRYCLKHSIKLNEFTEPNIDERNGIKIETNVIEVQGNFKKLLNLVYEFEQNYRIAKVAGVNFYSKKNNKLGKMELMAKIYLQNVITK